MCCWYAVLLLQIKSCEPILLNVCFAKNNNRVRTMCNSWPQNMETFWLQSFKNCVVQASIYLFCFFGILQTFHIQYSFSHWKYGVKAFDTNGSMILNGSDVQVVNPASLFQAVVLLPFTCSLSQRKVKEIAVSVSLHYMRKTWRNYK